MVYAACSLSKPTLFKPFSIQSLMKRFLESFMLPDPIRSFMKRFRPSRERFPQHSKIRHGREAYCFP
ncbi:hypothetical protein Hdeb2414_s0021g00574121 [Helianthus debilis subsp. tardiflorus]